MNTSTLRRSIAARRTREGDRGFTLIELLVVVLIIGILAAIAIPVFLGQQNAAKDSAAKSDLANIRLALTGYYTAGNTATPTAALLASYGYTKSTTTAATIFANSAVDFCASVPSDSASNPVFKVLDGVGPIATGACTNSLG